ncbi:choline ABC transporter substrate-binding protein [Ruegeria arenilitoris]|uniref:choline ABC transporter substrate-binding protein n=1 Tax=Ruegeria arenilitoris TaxID=1173585 RepID=UPI00147F8797|nr:choline ABC transporter substrate-binding protein [Ruegeria arenilitoris]
MLKSTTSMGFAAVLLSAGIAHASCEEVRMAEPGWTDLALTSAIASVVVEALGYQPKLNVLGTSVIYESLVNDDLDVFLGYWDPAMAQFFAPYVDGGKVETLNQNLTGAKYTLAVPDYVHAAGVKDFADLAQHADKFENSFYGIEAGANSQTMSIIEQNDFGLGDWTVVESSEQGMLAQVRRAVAKEDWVVFLAWAPHPMNVEFDIEYLTGGDAYFGPDFGAASVHTQSRLGYAEECPNMGKFFTQLTFDVDLENEGMGYIINDGEDPEDAAQMILKKRPEVLEAWLEGVQTIDGKPGLAAVQSHLGLPSGS